MIRTIIFTAFPSELHGLGERGEGGAARGGGGGDAGLLAAREPADPVLAQRRAGGACRDQHTSAAAAHTHPPAAQGARHYCTALLPTPEPRAGPHCPSIQHCQGNGALLLWSIHGQNKKTELHLCQCAVNTSMQAVAAFQLPPQRHKNLFFSGGRSPSLHLPTAHPEFHQHMHYWCLLGTESAATGKE